MVQHTHTSFAELARQRMADPRARAGYAFARRAFELGEQVRALREARGLSPAELSAAAGTTVRQIERLEAGDTVLNILTLDRIGSVLGAALFFRFEPLETAVIR